MAALGEKFNSALASMDSPNINIAKHTLKSHNKTLVSSIGRHSSSS